MLLILLVSVGTSALQEIGGIEETRHWTCYRLNKHGIHAESS
jgi:hypothetical protein